jgi:hypothetical protein
MSLHTMLGPAGRHDKTIDPLLGGRDPNRRTRVVRVEVVAGPTAGESDGLRLPVGEALLALTNLVAAWAFVTGIVEVLLALQRDEVVGSRALWALSGLVSIALGIVLAVRPDIGALTLATLFWAVLHRGWNLRPRPAAHARSLGADEQGLIEA